MKNLNSISTVWTNLRQAHCGDAHTENQAKRALLERYGAAVRHYLLAMTRDYHAAEEISQQFAIHLWQGKFRNADPSRGRFRNYVKKALAHLLCNHRRKQRKRAREISLENDDLANLESETKPKSCEADGRQQVLQCTWTALAQAHPKYYAVLRFRVCHPEISSRDMAKYFSRVHGSPVTDAAIRQTLRRARALFLKLLMDELARTLPAPTAGDLAHELARLRLLDHCREFLEDYSARGGVNSKHQR